MVEEEIYPDYWRNRNSMCDSGWLVCTQPQLPDSNSTLGSSSRNNHGAKEETEALILIQ